MAGQWPCARGVQRRLHVQNGLHVHGGGLGLHAEQAG